MAATPRLLPRPGPRPGSVRASSAAWRQGLPAAIALLASAAGAAAGAAAATSVQHQPSSRPTPPSPAGTSSGSGSSSGPGSGSASASPGPTRPHVVIFLLDDAGRDDVGFTAAGASAAAAPPHTPHMDSLAQQGVVLEHFCECPVPPRQPCTARRVRDSHPRAPAAAGAPVEPQGCRKGGAW